MYFVAGVKHMFVQSICWPHVAVVIAPFHSREWCIYFLSIVATNKSGNGLWLVKDDMANPLYSLGMPLAECPIIFQVCCMLHNCCIYEWLQLDNEVSIERMYGTGEMQLGCIPSDISSVPHSGSVLWIRIVQRIQNKSLSRPELNVQHRNFEDSWTAIYFDVDLIRI